MRWRGREKSTHVDDRRGRSVKRVGGTIGIGTLILALAYTFLTGNPPTELLQQMQQQPQTQQQAPAGTHRPDDELADFVKVVFKDNEDVWTKIFRDQLHRRYQYPTLVIYDGVTQAACGMAQSAMGPFYCPADGKVYLDLSFYRDLKNKFGATGDFAMAYVISHEVGHHVQNLLGITRQVERMRPRMSKKDFNKLSVRLELQADYLAGVWAHHIQKMKHVLDDGDIEEAVRAAAAVGDDRIQKRSMGYVVPDAFTHGTSEQRVRWFLKGYKSGDVNGGNTFDLPYNQL